MALNEGNNNKREIHDSERNEQPLCFHHRLLFRAMDIQARRPAPNDGMSVVVTLLADRAAAGVPKPPPGRASASWQLQKCAGHQSA